MKKKNKTVMGFGLAAMCVLLAVGCGDSSYNASSQSKSVTTDAAAYSYETDDIYLNAASAELYEEAAEADAGSASGELRVQDTSRKLIKNVNLDVETEEFDTLLKTVTEKTESLGGYVESSYTYNGSYYYGSGNRNADLTLRIPQEKLDEFLSTIADISNVVSRNESVTDVTLQYVDLASHKEALETEQARLIELLEQAESVEDMITIESRLSEVRYQIESMESQLRTMDNQVSYSTVYLYISEVIKLTPIKEQTTWEKISTGFSDSLEDVGRGIKNFFIGLIINLPYLAVWAVVIVIAVLIIRLLRKLWKKRKAAEKKKKTGTERQVTQKQENEQIIAEQEPSEKVKEQKEEK